MPLDFYYHPVSPPCKSVMMLAKHLDIELNLIEVGLERGEQKSPDFLKVNPQGQVPALDDEGLVLSESRAILQYLCNRYAPNNDVYPRDPKKRAKVDQMLNFDIGSLFQSIREFIFPQFFDKQPLEGAEEKFKNNLRLLDTFIGSEDFVAGDNLTIADISLFVAATIFKHFGYLTEDYPNVNRWWNKLSECPSIREVEDSIPPEVLTKYLDNMKAKMSNK